MGDLIFEISVLGIAIFLYAAGVTLDSKNPISVMRPYWWPKMILILILIASFALILTSVRELWVYRRPREASKKAWPWLLAQTVNIILLVALQNLLGFLVSAIIFSIVSSFIIDGKLKAVHIFISFAIPFGLTLFFGSVMGVVLPRGVGFLRELSFLIY